MIITEETNSHIFTFWFNAWQLSTSIQPSNQQMNKSMNVWNMLNTAGGVVFAHKYEKKELVTLS